MSNELELVKLKNEHFNLLNKNGEIVADTLDINGTLGIKLNFVNCLSLWNEVQKEINEPEIVSPYAMDSFDQCYKQGYLKGFNTHAELNKEKVYTRGDMDKAIMFGCSQGKTQGWVEIADEKIFLTSLTQPPKVMVEIEMEENVSTDFAYEYKQLSTPKLTPDGCIILKLKK